MERSASGEFLKGFDAEGVRVCSCGEVHRLAVREVRLADGLLAQVPDHLLRLHGPGIRPWILSDERTEAAAGGGLKRALAGRLAWSEEILPGDPKPHCTYELAGRLAARVGRSGAGLILAVGAGTISDLAKKVSLESGLPNWSLMTAPSVDAYTSGRSNFKSGNGTASIPATPSRVVLGDLAVLEAAPREMVLAGLGDLLAKFLACLDWQVSAWVTGEKICPETRRASLGAARAAVEAARELEVDHRRACLRLSDAQLTSGLVMQSMDSSRPAGSVEHSAAHLWEIGRAARVDRLDLHGLRVGLAARLAARAYRELYRLLESLPVDIPARVSALSREPPWEETLEERMQPFRPLVERETRGRPAGPAVWREQLERIEANRGRILKEARSILDELEAGLQILQDRGFPFRLADFGMEPAAAVLPFRHIRLLRNRFNTFDLMHLLGVEEPIVRRLEEETRRPGA